MQSLNIIIIILCLFRTHSHTDLIPYILSATERDAVPRGGQCGRDTQTGPTGTTHLIRDPF
jgi:hypothetical protein